MGDPVRIELDISLPEGYRGQIPKPDNQIGDFAVLEFHPGPETPPLPSAAPQPVATPDGKMEPGALAHHRARIVTAVYKTGEFTFPSLQLRLVDKEGKETIVPTPTVAVRITSVVTGENPQLKDLKKQAEIPEPAPWLLWIALAAAVLLLAAIAWRLHRRRAPAAGFTPGPRMDPLDLAEAELRDLLARGLLEKNFVKPFYVSLAEIVKRALAAGYGVTTLEKTTTEIMEEMRDRPEPCLPREELEQIETFLLSCDIVKFAKYIPASAGNDAAIRDAFQLLELCRKRRADAAVSPAPQAAEVP